MNPLELTVAITTLANALACQLNDDELELLGVMLTQLADTLFTITPRRGACAGVDKDDF